MYEYDHVKHFYEGKVAKKSGRPYIAHIDEGLKILDLIHAGEQAKRAFCLHPLVQGDDELVGSQFRSWPTVAEPTAIIFAMEYRRVANLYLSKRKISSIDEIELSPLKQVNDMLIADKVQNKKDFVKYVLPKHPHTAYLTEYFDNWLKRLGVSEERYGQLLLSLERAD